MKEVIEVSAKCQQNDFSTTASTFTTELYKLKALVSSMTRTHREINGNTSQQDLFQTGGWLSISGQV